MVDIAICISTYIHDFSRVYWFNDVVDYLCLHEYFHLNYPYDVVVFGEYQIMEHELFVFVLGGIHGVTRCIHRHSPSSSTKWRVTRWKEFGYQTKPLVDIEKKKEQIKEFCRENFLDFSQLKPVGIMCTENMFSPLSAREFKSCGGQKA